LLPLGLGGYVAVTKANRMPFYIKIIIINGLLHYFWFYLAWCHKVGAGKWQWIAGWTGIIAEMFGFDCREASPTAM